MASFFLIWLPSRGSPLQMFHLVLKRLVVNLHDLIITQPSAM